MKPSPHYSGVTATATMGRSPVQYTPRRNPICVSLVRSKLLTATRRLPPESALSAAFVGVVDAGFVDGSRSFVCWSWRLSPRGIIPSCGRCTRCTLIVVQVQMIPCITCVARQQAIFMAFIDLTLIIDLFIASRRLAFFTTRARLCLYFDSRYLPHDQLKIHMDSTMMVLTD